MSRLPLAPPPRRRQSCPPPNSLIQSTSVPPFWSVCTATRAPYLLAPSARAFVTERRGHTVAVPDPEFYGRIHLPHLRVLEAAHYPPAPALGAARLSCSQAACASPWPPAPRRWGPSYQRRIWPCASGRMYRAWSPPLPVRAARQARTGRGAAAPSRRRFFADSPVEILLA